MSMALTLHFHPLASFCWKVLIALYENGAPFEGRVVNLGDSEARAAFAALWPTAKIPLLEDNGRIVPETSIMIEHLDRRHPGRISLLPADPEQQLETRLWDRVFDLYVMGPMQTFIAQQLRPETDRDARTEAEAVADLRTAYDLIENRMRSRMWAAGHEFSMADCAAAPALFYAAIVSPFPPKHTNLARYFEGLMARPSVARTISEAQPYFKYFPLRHAMPSRFLSEGGHAA
jgi:glutathione S-transferase